MTQLWENAAPTSDFVAQTVSIDYNGYNLLAIVFTNYKGIGDSTVSQTREISLIYPQKDSQFFIKSNTWALCARKVSVVTNGLEFSKAVYRDNATWNASDGDCIPIRIYGIRL